MRKLPLLVLVALVALVVVPIAAAFRFTDASREPPTGVVGQPYSHKIGFMAGCKGVNLMVASGSLPPGLGLVGAALDDKDSEEHNWRIEGVPTGAGSFGFWLRATNLCPGDSTEEPFMINVVSGLAIENGSLPNATVGQPYQATKLTASGGGNQSWSVTSGALPPGLALATDGTLSGTVPAGTPKGDFNVTVRVSDGSRVATRAYALAVRSNLAVAQTAAVPQAEVGKGFTFALPTATGGSESYTWSVAPETQLPAGITLDAAAKALRGTPTAVGTFPVKLVLTDTEGRTASVDVPLAVAAKLAIANKSLRAGRVGKLYTVTFRTQGGAGPLVWKLKSFKPAGVIQWDKTTGTLSWTPRKARPVTITVRATDSLKALAEQTLTLQVKAAPKPKKKAAQG